MKHACASLDDKLYTIVGQSRTQDNKSGQSFIAARMLQCLQGIQSRKNKYILTYKAFYLHLFL